MKLSARLSELMKQKGLTQEELSRRSGVSQATISTLIRGVALNPSVSVFEKLGEALDCPPDELHKAFVDDRYQRPQERVVDRQLLAALRQATVAQKEAALKELEKPDGDRKSEK